MGNGASAAAAKHELEDRELGQAHVDASSEKVIDSNAVTSSTTQLVKKGKAWYMKSNHGGSDTIVFSITKQRQFASTVKAPIQVLVDRDGDLIAVLQQRSRGKAKYTLIFRPTPTFDGQEPYPDLYKEKEQDKGHAKLYLFSRIQTSGASNCDATYALLQVHVVYNDPDFASFHDPPMYRAAKVTGGGGTPFLGAIMDGTDPGGETLLGRITAGTAEIANGVDIIATILLGLTVNASGSSARGTAHSGVV
eukprot:Nitzschia sp. Nitz4//scaffold26_size159584//45046//45795//NITZ4_002480-RA/size159584-processed-gene-0.189-mRNA-1//1//CDS//3329545049//5390//frame0